MLLQILVNSFQETICAAAKDNTKQTTQVDSTQRTIEPRIVSTRKHSWRSKTWKSDYKSQRTASLRNRQYTRKHSLTVPGELYQFQHHHHHQHYHHHTHHHHHSRHSSAMGHQQQQEHKPVETKPSDVKLAKSKTPSPISTPSPSGSVAGDEPSGCSSCSSSGLDLEFTRKCTVSADSLLLHPDITAFTRSDEQRTKTVEQIEINRQLLTRRRISSSISSDEIHKHFEFTSEERESQRKLTTQSSTNRASSKDEPSTSAACGPSTSKLTSKRKDSVTHIVLSGPGRIARLLRRTYSAGSRDTPSHALFLREKPMRKHHPMSMSADADDERKRTKKHRPALEDMKQRLRFLRRRNTDSLLDSSSVRPNPDEVKKWSQSFHYLMSNKYGSSLFKAFLAREFSAENIEFWLACEDYKISRQSKLISKSKKIFDNFIAVRSPKEVNLSSKVRSDIEQRLNSPDKTVFEVAQRKIQSILESDAYIRFLQSELYKELLIADKPDDISRNVDDTGKSSPESTL